MQSLSTMPLAVAAMQNKFVVPESIKNNPELLKVFENSIAKNRRVFNWLLTQNVDPYLLIYIAPHATAINFISTLNAREILHICNLRNCNRAQWEIRYLSQKILRALRGIEPEFFARFGPSCYTFGVCPEGRLCCGKQAEMKEKYDKVDF